MEERSIEFNGSPIYYRTSGEGEVVMFVHGFAEDSSIWNYHAGQLSNNYKVILPDLPGSGKTPAIGSGSESGYLSLEDCAQMLNRILEQEHAPTCIMIGHSMGGYITLAFAEKYGQKLKGFGLFHSSAFADTEEKIETRRKAIKHINENGAEDFLRMTIPSMFAESAKETNRQSVDEIVERFTHFEPKVLTGFYHAMIDRPDRSHILKTFPKPILFIIGEEDNAVPLDASLRQCHLPVQSHVHILKSVGHMAMVEKQAETAQIVCNFCDTCIHLQKTSDYHGNV
jgi:pimeloyl-ACP methyl ester carboxylesterase